MVKENKLDRITDLIKVRVNRITSNAQKQFKGTNPYRQEPVSPKERLFDFSQFTNEDIDFARQNFGDEIVDKYLRDMDKLMRRYK